MKLTLTILGEALSIEMDGEQQVQQADKQLLADAELGRLVRAMPQEYTLSYQPPNYPESCPWLLRDQGNGTYAWGATPEATLNIMGMKNNA